MVVLLPFSFIEPKETQAIVGVDDAILFTILGLGGLISIGGAYGISKSGALEKTGDYLSDTLQELGNGFKSVNNDLAFAKSTVDLLPKILDALESQEGSTYSEYVDSYLDENGYNCFQFKKGEIISISVPNNSDLEIIYNPYGVSTKFLHTTTSNTFYTLVSGDDFRLKSGSNFGSTLCSLSDNKEYSFYFKYKVVNGTTTTTHAEIQEEFPTVKDVTNPPTSISLDKNFIEDVATTYSEQYPDDNNGDKKVDYETLIPLFFQLLEKKLGDGTITPSINGGIITPQNLSNNGISSYVYEDGSVQGQNPYNFQKLGDNNINVEQNVNINNGSEVTEEEKNGILNILDNGIRKTTTLLNNLKESMSELGNTLTGLFELLPEPVSYLFYSALCLSLVFFILSLRR